MKKSKLKIVQLIAYQDYFMAVTDKGAIYKLEKDKYEQWNQWTQIFVPAV